jgi:hypothetical protein
MSRSPELQAVILPQVTHLVQDMELEFRDIIELLQELFFMSWSVVQAVLPRVIQVMEDIMEEAMATSRRAVVEEQQILE